MVPTGDTELPPSVFHRVTKIPHEVRRFASFLELAVRTATLGTYDLCFCSLISLRITGFLKALMTINPQLGNFAWV